LFTIGYIQTVLVIPSKRHFNFNLLVIFRRGPPNGDGANAGEVGTNATNIWLSIDDCCSATDILTVFRAVVYNSYSARLFTAQIATHQ